MLLCLTGRKINIEKIILSEEWSLHKVYHCCIVTEFNVLLKKQKQKQNLYVSIPSLTLIT